MSREDWYRNTAWNDEIKAAFLGKLKRARDKGQYLRIQAGYLAADHPSEALRLLEMYFANDANHFDAAQALLQLAEIHESLGDLDQAHDCYLRCLQRQREYPQLRTSVWIGFPLFAIRHGRIGEYRASVPTMEVPEVIFPIDHFRYYYVQAEFSVHEGNPADAIAHAERALAFVEVKDSGLRYHRELGLVGKEEAGIVRRLLAIKAGQGT
jgi:tetratricopeptide (TPR) repeat protein